MICGCTEITGTRFANRGEKTLRKLEIMKETHHGVNNLNCRYQTCFQTNFISFTIRPVWTLLRKLVTRIINILTLHQYLFVTT